MTHHMITIEDTGEQYRCSESKSVLAGMEALSRKGIPVGCRGGGCGVCKVEVKSGPYSKGPMSREHVSVEEEGQRIALACRIKPLGEMRLTVLGKMKKSVCREVGPAQRQ